MSVKRSANQQEIDQCLKDAGVEDVLTYQEKLEFYEAIKVSEGGINENITLDLQSDGTSHNEEENVSPEFDFDCDEQAEEMFSFRPMSTGNRRKKNKKQQQKYISGKNKSTFNQNAVPKANALENHRSPSQNRRVLKDKTDNISDDLNIFENPSATHSPLKVHIKPLQFQVPFLFSNRLDSLPYEEKVKAIYDYHVSLVEKYKKVQSRSIKFAKWGKPILPSYRFNGTLDKHSMLSEPQDQRQKNNEIGEIRPSSPIREEIVETESLDGKPISSPSHSGRSSDSPTPLKPLSPVQRDPLEIQLEEMESTIPQRTLVPEFDILKDDISETSFMKRDNSKNLSRSEILFDSLIEADQKKRRQEMEIQQFQKTLEQLSDDEFIEELQIKRPERTYTDDVFMVKDSKLGGKVRGLSTSTPFLLEINKEREEGMFRRISPPNPFAKRIKRTRNRKGQKDDDQKKNPAKKTRKVFFGDSRKEDANTEPLEEEQATCPICNKQLPQSMIEEHAEFCTTNGEEPIETILEPGEEIVTCGICDRVFRFSNDYEVHVYECIRKRMSKS